MIRPVRLALTTAAALLFATATIAKDAASTAPDRVWAQSVSDIKPDPAVRFGTLPNGMRYAIMKNATPSNQVSLRLRVGSGSLEETDAQQGLAHFLEHMAFNGSKKVPQGEMIRILERLGLGFGADTNASTEWTQTVYQLDLPKSDAESVDTGLMLMREVTSELTLAQKAMDQERGVVLSEERARDTPAYRVFKARLAVLLKNQLAARRLPIGTVDVLQNAQADRLVDYYRHYYRPERTTLVVVGAIDPAAMEEKVKALFSSWTATGPAGPEPDLGSPAKRAPETHVLVEPGAQMSINIDWIKPYEVERDSEAKRRKDLVEAVGFAVLNRRLERLARSENPPFIGAGVGRDQLFRSANVTSMTVNADQNGWREALRAVEETRRRALQYGLRQDEVDRELTEYRTMLAQAADAAATRRTPQLAAQLVDSVDEGEVFTTPADDLALFERATKGLTAAEVGKALEDAFAGQGPNLFISTPKPIDGGEQAVATVFKAAQTAPVSPPSATEAASWPYESFGAPGKVVEQKEVLDLATSFVRFENGVRLTVKPTKFRDKQVLVSVRFGNGKLDLPKDRVGADWAAGFAFIQGGLKQISLEDIEQVLSSKVYDATLSIGDEAFALTGRTRPEDLDVQMQVLAAYMTEPGWRPEGFQRMRTYGQNLLRQMEATPQGVMRRDLDGLLHSNDARWKFPDAAQIDAGQASDVRALLEKPLSTGAIEVVVVGDISIEHAVDSVAKTFGALPARPTPPPPPASGRQVAFPAPVAQPVLRTHKGRADQAVAYQAWPLTDFFADPQKARETRLMQLILELRLIDQIRIAEGATYSPSADWEESIVFPGYGYVSANVEIPPAKVPGFYASVAKIVADLRDKPVGDDELERARRPRIEQLTKAKETNEYWLGQLAGAQTDPRRLEIIRAAIPGLQRVTAADVQRAARDYLVDAKSWKLNILPDGAK